MINTLLKAICFGPLGSYQIQENGKAISDFSFRTAFKVVENVSKKNTSIQHPWVQITSNYQNQERIVYLFVMVGLSFPMIMNIAST